MSATMARQGGWVQLEQSDMHLALNMAKMAQGGFSRAAIEETQQLVRNPSTEVQEEKKRGVVFAGHKMVKAVIERHPAMGYKDHTDGCLRCQYGTAIHPKTRRRRKGTSAPPPEPAAPLPRTPSPPRTPLAPPGDTDETECYEIDGMPSRCVYIHSLHPNTQFFNHNACAKYCKRNQDFIPDWLSTLSAVWKYR